MALDIHTLLLSSAQIRLACLFVFFLVAMRRPKEPCLWSWNAALLCSMCGTWLMAQYPVADELPLGPVTVMYLLFAGSLTFSWAGLRTCFCKRVSLPFCIGATIAPSLLYAILATLGAPIWVCLITVYGCCTIIAVVTALEALSPKEELWSKYVISGAFWLYALAFLASIGNLIANRGALAQIESGSIALIMDQFVGICLYFGYVAMLGERLALRLAELATTDTLTRLKNRRGLKRFTRSTTWSRNAGETATVLLFDIDHFKAINDTHGHEIGDGVLAAFANRLDRNRRSEDIAVRWGGEEFVLILPRTKMADGLSVAERLRGLVEQEALEAFEAALEITVSIGVADFKAESETLESAIARADLALYEAKRTGRNKVCWANPKIANVNDAPHPSPAGSAGPLQQALVQN